MENFKVIIVEDVPLELKGTEGIFRNEIPSAPASNTSTQSFSLSSSPVNISTFRLGYSSLVCLQISTPIVVEPPDPKSNNTKSGRRIRCWC